MLFLGPNQPQNCFCDRSSALDSAGIQRSPDFLASRIQGPLHSRKGEGRDGGKGEGKWRKRNYKEYPSVGSFKRNFKTFYVAADFQFLNLISNLPPSYSYRTCQLTDIVPCARYKFVLYTVLYIREDGKKMGGFRPFLDPPVGIAYVGGLPLGPVRAALRLAYISAVDWAVFLTMLVSLRRARSLLRSMKQPKRRGSGALRVFPSHAMIFRDRRPTSSRFSYHLIWPSA